MKKFFKIIWEEYSWILLLIFSILILISINFYSEYISSQENIEIEEIIEEPKEYLIYDFEGMEISNITRNIISDEYLAILNASDFIYVRSHMGSMTILYELIANTDEHIDRKIFKLSEELKTIWLNYGYNLNIVIGLVENKDSEIIYRSYTNGELDFSL